MLLFPCQLHSANQVSEVSALNSACSVLALQGPCFPTLSILLHELSIYEPSIIWAGTCPRKTPPYHDQHVSAALLCFFLGAEFQGLGRGHGELNLWSAGVKGLSSYMAHDTSLFWPLIVSGREALQCHAGSHLKRWNSKEVCPYL